MPAPLLQATRGVRLRPTITLHDRPPLAGDEPGPQLLHPPARIGRFTVEGMLGAGGRGTVLEAHDALLDRRVAIKVLHAEVTGGHDRRQSLRREARALARLSHPNVVQVFEVGEHEGRLYIAMERVVGQTFTAWCEARPRTFEQIRDILCEAGRGLVAAHARGLLHRDFKPENVLVGDDGRPRVVDFGLVRPLPRTTTGSRTFASLGPPSRGGRRAGTVPYMAPEQLIGQPLDARADQFAFCVTLYEAVYGQHPFAGPGPMEIGLRIIAGEWVKPSPWPGVPKWLPGVLARGLALRPEDRYEDMSALLRALQPPAIVRSRPSLALVGAAALVMLLGGSSVATPTPTDACTSAGHMLVGTWDRSRRLELEQAFLEPDLGYSQDTWLRVRDHLDVYAAGWRRADQRLCEAERAQTWDRAEVEARRGCLDTRLRDLRRLVDQLAQPDERLITRATSATSGLPEPDDCVDPAVAPPPTGSPSAEPEAVTELRATIAAADLEDELGRPARALMLLDGIVERAEAVGGPSLRAEALRARGQAEYSMGLLGPAESDLAEAFWLAQASDQPEQAVDAGVLLMHIVGDRQMRFHDGMAWARHTQALIDRGGIDGRRRAWVLNNRGTVLLRRGHFAAAQEAITAAIAIDDPRLRDSDRASFAVNLGGTYLLQHQPQQAKAQFLRAMRLRERAFGPRHPSLVSALTNLGGVYLAQGLPRQARPVLERALRIAEQPGQGPLVAGSIRVNLASALVDLHEYEPAREHLERAHEALVQTLGPGHPRLALVYGIRGDLLAALGHWDEAKQDYRRAVEVLEPVVGPEHPDVVTLRASLERPPPPSVPAGGDAPGSEAG